MHDCVVAGLGVVAVAQSVVIVHERVWLPLAEQAFQSVQDQVSAVQLGVGVGVGVGVVVEQLCDVAGLGVTTPAQSDVMLQRRVWLPLVEQAFQSVHDQVSAVHVGAGVEALPCSTT